MPSQTIQTRGATAALPGPLPGAPESNNHEVRFVTPLALGGDPVEPDEDDEDEDLEDLDDEEDDDDEDDIDDDDEDEDDEDEEAEEEK